MVDDTGLIVASDEKIARFDLDSEEFVWETDGLLAEFGAGPTSPTLDGESVYVGLSGHGGVMSIDTADGSRNWLYEDANAINGPITASESAIFTLDTDGNVTSIDKTNGDRAWGVNLPDGGTNTVIGLSNDELYFGDRSGTVYSFTVAGEKNWSHGVSDSEIYSPAITDRYVFLADDEPSMYAVERETGETVARKRLSDYSPRDASVPLAHTNRVGIITDQDGFVVFEVAENELSKLSESDVDGRSDVSPVVVDGRLFTAHTTVQAHLLKESSENRT